MYLIKYPSNISVETNNFEKYYEVAQNYNECNEYSIWWTDGSQDTEYYGGFSWITQQKREKGRLQYLYGYPKHLSDNNYCELLAIENCLKEVINDDSIVLNNKIYEIWIFSDSMSSLELLSINGYPKNEESYKCINNIFKYCHLLNNFNKSVKLIHTPAHSNIDGNEKQTGGQNMQ